MSDCVACLEPIREGARLCSRCGTAQGANRWKKIGRAVTWTGGAVTVISLAMGVVTLSGVYGQWREKQHTISEHVDAARWLAETGHYVQAWQMLAEALELSPSAPDVRRSQFDLALVWLRDFSAEKETARATLDELTSVLYRRLAGADDDEVATILAHVAWGQILRVRAELPISVDVDGLFEKALASSPRNGWANAFQGYWLLWQRGAGPDEVRLAQERFRVAIDGGLDRGFVRRLQLGSLASSSYGWSDELERAALAALLETARQMMQDSEPRPSDEVRRRILDGYGITGQAEHVESLVQALPPGDHLAVIVWLREGLDYGGRARMDAQLRYVEARLIEAQGDAEGALRRYRELLDAEHSTEPLDELVNAGIARLSGELPERALARKYQSDPVDVSDPWRFHVDTLLHFDPMYTPPNFDEALEFLSVAVAEKDPRIPGLLPALEEAEARVREVVAEGDERARLGAFTSGYSAGHHELAQSNLVRLSVLRGKSLAATDDLDAAVAKLGDAAKLAGALDEGSTLRALAAWELAGAYARRAEATSDAEDRARAVEELGRAVEAGAVDLGVAGWADVKGGAFRVLAREPAYRELIRGR
jgi:tetratricopeptide (TPR) repeat protein